MVKLVQIETRITLSTLENVIKLQLQEAYSTTIKVATMMSWTKNQYG